MSVYYKLAFIGQSASQAIVNLLYFGNEAGEGFAAYDENTAEDILAAAGETFVEDYLAALPDHYTLNLLRVSSVSERGVTNSPYDIDLIVNEAGIQGGGTSGAFVTAILPFTTTVAPDAARNLKRSYLAYGPVAEDFVNDDQSLTAGFLALISPLMLALRGELVGSLNVYLPVRIARTVAPAPVGVGIVRSIAMAPYASTRKSRKKTPRGT